MSEPTIEVQYRCEKCGVDWVSVQVRERRSKDEDVADWVRLIVGGEVQLDHKRRTGKVCETVDLKIPMPKDSPYIGRGSRQ